MKTKQPLEKTIYTGSFVHSKSLQELESCQEAAIGVDEQGVIAFVERDATVAKERPGWNSARKIQIPKNAFLFPGFIGADRP